jgi:hypothetical protein
MLLGMIFTVLFTFLKDFHPCRWPVYSDLCCVFHTAYDILEGRLYFVLAFTEKSLY